MRIQVSKRIRSVLVAKRVTLVPPIPTPRNFCPGGSDVFVAAQEERKRVAVKLTRSTERSSNFG